MPPAGRGKNERFHRTLNAEVLAMRTFHTLPESAAFDTWLMVYNLERPHEGSICMYPLIASGEVSRAIRVFQETVSD